METAAKRLVFEVTLTEDQGNRLRRREHARRCQSAVLDEMIAKLKADPTGGFIEVEGYTDNIGAPPYNERLGLERAKTVKRYLHEQHQMPLHKINVISYGEDQSGRAQHHPGRARAEPPRRRPRALLSALSYAAP